MYARTLAVRDFRNWPTADVEFEPGSNALVGPNGQGKTNLIEALAYLATHSSHRVATDAPLVRHGAERAVVSAGLVRDDRELLVEVEINPGKANRARVNRSGPTRARDALGIVRAVVFAPEDLALVRGDPAERRRFLDDLLVTRSPRYAAVRADYDRVLKQRNALLRTAALGGRGPDRDTPATLDVWDGHLATHGADLLTGRLGLLAALAPRVTRAYADVAPDRDAAAVSYTGPPEEVLAPAGTPAREVLEAELLARLAKARPRELDRGVTLVGPHRDDLTITLGDRPARGYASHGESWSLALALKLGAYELLRADGTGPILVLDDVFAELDSDRRDRLAARADAAEQTVITAAVAEDVPVSLCGTRFDVADGKVRRVR